MNQNPANINRTDIGASASGSLSHQPPLDARPCVVLRHDLVGGSWHYDLLLQQAPTRDTSPPDPNAKTLMAFRLEPAPVGTAPTLTKLTIAPGVILAAHGTDPPLAHATRMPDHRTHYLTFEGTIPGNRGTVKRIAQGTYTLIELDPEGLLFRIWWEPRTIVTLEARFIREDRWRLAIH